MNCKPGLAMIVKCDPDAQWALGLVVTLTRLWPHSLPGDPAWEFEPEPRLEALNVAAIADKALMPIAPPASDNSILRVTDEPVTA